MKNKSLREKFKNDVVKPLYRNVKSNVLVSVHSTYNLEGDDFTVKRKISDVGKINQRRNKKSSLLPGACQSDSISIDKVFNLRHNGHKINKMIGNEGNSKLSDNNGKEKVNQLIQADKFTVPSKFAETWLRVYPLPQQEKESVCSIVLRCIACQFGLASILVLWTLIWVFVIHSFEGPYELKVVQDFEREQNQLVIDLATELRQITPISPKWREAIERRIQEERQLTILAVGKGARAHPGQFWDLPGTFLFTIYVMTALGLPLVVAGFGAPVPHTIGGRTAALFYAILAIPTNIYLMVNASTFALAKVKVSRCLLKSNRKRKSYMEERHNMNNTKESPSCSRNSEMLKTSKCGVYRKKIMRCLRVFSACRCVPTVAILYFTCGALAFGLLRGRSAVETIMFPLEFTTTGGLEHVLGHVRILYGFYVEGAMIVLSFALASLKRLSNSSVNNFAKKYRLYQTV